jgi:hypothetical protein
VPHPAGRPALPQSTLTIGLIALLAFVVEILVEHLMGKPLEQAAPHTPRWWLIYVSLVLDAVLVGGIVSSLLVGGGSQIVHAGVKHLLSRHLT